MKKVFFFIAGLSMSLLCHAQKDAELINQYVGDIRITNTLYSTNNIKSIKDLEGKVVIIDFWSSNCLSCFKSFPAMSALQQAFHNDLAFYYATTQTKAEVEAFFNRRPEFKKYQLQFITDAKDLAKKFPHASLPYYVWIGKDGRLKGLTGKTEVTEANLKQLITQNKLSVPVKKTYLDFDYAAPLLLTEDVRPEAIESSLLSNSVKDLPAAAGFRRQGGNLRKMYALNVSAHDLFMLAFGPQIKILPVDRERLINLQLKDSSRFYDFQTKNYLSAPRLYCFELSMLVDTAVRSNLPLLLRSQKVLCHYFRVKTEVRSEATSCYILTPSANFKPSGNIKPVSEGGIGYVDLKAQKPETVLAVIKGQFNSNIPIVVEGFNGQLIDLYLKEYNKFEMLREDLSKAGIMITEGKRTIRKLYIKEE